MTPTGAAATRLLGGPGQAQVQAQAQQAPEEIDHKEEINTFWEKCCVFVGMGCTLIAAGVLLFVLLLLIMFPDQRDKNTTAGMQACFFGLLAILFVVLVRMLLVPRYTGDNGAFRSMLFRPMRHEWQWRPTGPDTYCFMDAGGKFSKVNTLAFNGLYIIKSKLYIAALAFPLNWYSFKYKHILSTWCECVSS